MLVKLMAFLSSCPAALNQLSLTFLLSLLGNGIAALALNVAGRFTECPKIRDC